MDFSEERINFLDVIVIKNGNQLKTDLYTKKADSHQFLHAQSCQRNVYKKSIRYGQAIRIKRICSHEDTLAVGLEQLQGWLTKRDTRMIQ